MSYIVKINGRVVTKEEELAYEARMIERHGGIPEMARCRKAPGLDTDDTFMRGKKSGDCAVDLDDKVYAAYREKARRAGVSTTGKFYFTRLAQEPGDPNAWVGSKAEAIAAAQRTGQSLWDHRGKCLYNAPIPDVPDEPYRPCEKIVQREVDEYIRNNPGCAPTPEARAELADRLRREMTPDFI